MALFATHLLKTLLWGVKTTDPTTFATVGILLITVAGIASLIPALRLTHVDPAQTLRAGPRRSPSQSLGRAEPAADPAHRAMLYKYH